MIIEVLTIMAHAVEW